MVRPRLALHPFLLAALLALGCQASPQKGPESPPNLLLISIDSLRPDHLGCYGYSRPTSPNLDQLAKDGIVFERAYSTSTWTLPAHLSLLTSLYPETHRVNKSWRALHRDVVLLPELLSTAGYRSAAVVSGPLLDRRFGFDRGWERYDDEILDLAKVRNNHAGSHKLTSSPQTHRRASKLLEQLGDGPFFLFLHYWDVHYDYQPPPPFDRIFDSDYAGSVSGLNFAKSHEVHAKMDPVDLAHIIALYDGEIRWVDEWLGKLFHELRQRGLFDDLVIVVTADHGDEFFEHGEKGHRSNLYDTTLRVPLVVRLPGARFAGRRATTPVSLVDVAPTLTALAGLSSPAAFSGRALLPPAGESWRESPGSDLFAELLGRQGALIRGTRKLHVRFAGRDRIRGRPEVYELASDPLERLDLAEREPEQSSELAAALLRSRQRLESLGRRLPPHAATLEPQRVEELAALGYL